MDHLTLTSAVMGAIVGAVLGLTGAGGGILAVPLLVFGLHLGMRDAAPIGLLAVGIGAAIGAALGLREGIVRYRAAAFIGGAGMATAPVAVALARVAPERPLLFAFAIVLALVSWKMFHSSSRAFAEDSQPTPQPCVISLANGRLVWTTPCAALLGASGAVSGLLSGLLGVGGGFVIVPVLTRFTNIPAQQILATSLAVISLVSASGIAAATFHHAIIWPVAIPFTVGTVAALLVARTFVTRLDGLVVARAFSAVSLTAAAMLLLRGLGFMPS